MMFGTGHFPNYRQLDQMDCGPTCIKIIAKHYGKEYDLEHLRQISNLHNGGVSLAGISEALGMIGLDAFPIDTGRRRLINYSIWNFLRMGRKDVESKKLTAISVIISRIGGEFDETMKIVQHAL